jgi:hypothetical protein
MMPKLIFSIIPTLQKKIQQEQDELTLRFQSEFLPPSS